MNLLNVFDYLMIIGVIAFVLFMTIGLVTVKPNKENVNKKTKLWVIKVFGICFVLYIGYYLLSGFFTTCTRIVVINQKSVELSYLIKKSKIINVETISTRLLLGINSSRTMFIINGYHLHSLSNTTQKNKIKKLEQYLKDNLTDVEITKMPFRP